MNVKVEGETILTYFQICVSEFLTAFLLISLCLIL